jgi:hypothetical protein
MNIISTAKSFSFKATAERLAGLGIAQLYIFYVLVFAVFCFSITSGNLGFSLVSSVFITILMLGGLYTIIYIALPYHSLTALITAFVLAILPLTKFLHYPIALTSLAGLFLLMSKWRQFEIKNFLALPLMLAVVFGSTIYIDFEYARKLSTGNLNLDSLFHVAIAAMYKNYGIPSTGLDGLVAISYHTLSHKIMAGLSVLSGLDTMSTYAHLFFLLGPFLLVFSLAGLAVQLNNKVSILSALITVAGLMLAVITLPVFSNVGFWDSYLTSESYLSSLALLVASLSGLFAYRRNQKAFVLLAGSMALMVLTGMAKGSVGVLGFFVLGLFGIIVFRSIRYWTLLLVASVCFYLLVIESVSNNAIVHFKPLDFVEMRVHVFGMKYILLKFTFFIVFHFLPVWLCLYTGFVSIGKKYVLTNEFLTIFALLLPALFLSLSLSIPGGAIYYFSNVPVTLSFAFLATRFDHISKGGCKRIIIILLVATPIYIIGRSLEWYGNGVSWLFLMYLLFFIMLTNYGFFIKQWFFVLLLAGAGCALTYPAFIGRTMFGAQGQGGVDASNIVEQLKAERIHLPLMTQVKIENPEVLLEKIGCSAYWAFPAILERPMTNGLPVPPWCTELNGFYGLSEYGYKKKVDIPFGKASLDLKQ